MTRISCDSWRYKCITAVRWPFTQNAFTDMINMHPGHMTPPNIHESFTNPLRLQMRENESPPKSAGRTRAEAAVVPACVYRHRWETQKGLSSNRSEAVAQ